MPGSISRLWHPPRAAVSGERRVEEIQAFIESRALEYSSKLEDEFVQHALNLGVESGMVLDVGTQAGLIPLKLLWHNENFYAIGMDQSGAMVERARETANAWELGERAFFQVGDARQMRFKSGYFDLVISDCTLHRFDDAAAVLREISRVLKPKGGLLIRDFRRPKRWKMKRHVEQQTQRYGRAMRAQLEAAVHAAYTPAELLEAVRESGLSRTQLIERSADHMLLERRGETDPGSWIVAREQYR